MKFLILLSILLIVPVDLHRHHNTNDNNTLYKLDYLPNNYDNHKFHRNKEILHDLLDHDRDSSLFQREKMSSSHRKTLEHMNNRDESEKPLRHTYLSKSNNRPLLSKTPNRAIKTTTESYVDEASLCINEFDIKTEQLVKVKELKNGAHMIRFIRIEEPSSSHGLTVRDICMLNCCIEEGCDLAMLSEQRTNDGYKCYLFACNDSCTYVSHQDYTSMILRRDLSFDDEPHVSNKQSKYHKKLPDAPSSSLPYESYNKNLIDIASTCRSIEFSCRDGSCIPYYDVCNTYEDCPSGIDEAMCSQEFTLHQRTQQESRRRPSTHVENDAYNDPDNVYDDLLDGDLLTTKIPQTTHKKLSLPKTKSNSLEDDKQDKNTTSSFFYNVDLATQERVAKLQKLKEYLEETKGPEAWYHLFQTLVQPQKHDHSNLEPEETDSSSTNNSHNFKAHLLALEQQWIADRQKTISTTTTTTRRPRVIYRKPKKTTTKRMKVVHNDDLRLWRPPGILHNDLTDDDDDDDRNYWQSPYDDRRGDHYYYHQKSKSTSSTSKPKMRYPSVNRNSTTTRLMQANGGSSDDLSYSTSFLRESSLVLLLLLGLVFTTILLILLGFYCRDSCKRGRIAKNHSTDADYLINGLYL